MSHGGASRADEGEHAPLADGWSLWRTVQVRGAGFPAAWLDRLHAAEATAAADALIDAEALVAAQRGATPAGALAPSRAAMASPRSPPRSPSCSPSCSPSPAAPDPAALALARFEEAFAAAARASEVALAAFAAEPRFREAVTWQNRAAVRDGLDVLLRRAPGGWDKLARRKGQLVHRYLQRYCAKNDAIGFFGPIGWGSIREGDAPLVRVRPGRGLLARRRTSFEPWAIAALADRFAREPSLRARLCPRLHPGLRLEGAMLVGSRTSRRRDGRRALAPAELCALSLAQGDRPLGAIAERLVAAGAATDLAAATALLDDLVARDWLRVGFAVALEARPEERLRDALAGLAALAVPGAAPVTVAATEAAAAHAAEAAVAVAAAEAAAVAAREAIAEVDGLVAARDALAAAAGSAGAVDAAYAALEARFARAAERAPTRLPGRTYAARTLVYEDCVRDAEVELGEGLLAQIAAPLAAVLASARWSTHEVARRFAEALERAFVRLGGDSGGHALDLARLWRAAEPLFTDEPGSPIDAARVELCRRWADALGLLAAAPPAGAPLRLRTAEVGHRIAELFAAPGPGWPSARHHGVDLLVAVRPSGEPAGTAASPVAGAGARDAALAAGAGLEVILGEVHPGLHPFETLSAIEQHPDPDALRAAFAKDLRRQRVQTIPDTDFARSAHDARLAPGDLHLDLGGRWASWRSPAEVVRLGSLVVERVAGASAGRLRVRHADDGRVFDLLEVFDRPLRMAAAQAFAIAPAPRPRILLDDLVLARAAWRLDAGLLGFARARSAAARFLGARRLARALGLPRLVFCRAPDEPKPFCCDLESLAGVDLLAGLARAAGERGLEVTEMRPDVGELWLADAEGALYTSEVRSVAVDPRAWEPPT